MNNLILLFVIPVGQRTTPSVVAFADDGTRHVGDVAKRQVSIWPEMRLTTRLESS